MKITSAELKNIVKEELTSLLFELDANTYQHFKNVGRDRGDSRGSKLRIQSRDLLVKKYFPSKQIEISQANKADNSTLKFDLTDIMPSTAKDTPVPDTSGKKFIRLIGKIENQIYIITFTEDGKLSLKSNSSQNGSDGKLVEVSRINAKILSTMWKDFFNEEIKTNQISQF